MVNKALVTGGAGFIGSTVVRRLLKMNFQVTVLDDLSTGLAENLPTHKRLKLVRGDVRNLNFVSRTVRRNPYVLHLAAQAFIPFSYQMPLHVAEVNALGSINVFEACKNSKIERLVHVSSSEVYGAARYVPMDEKHPIRPYSTYSVAKAAADFWAQSFFWEHELPVVILRPFNTFGPRESLPYFIPEMIRQCLKESVIYVGNLETSRDFTYIEDTTDAMIRALTTKDIEGEVMNIGTGRTLQMKDILALIQEETDTQGKEIVSDKKRFRPRDVETLITSNSKAKKILGWKPTITFEDGLRKTIAWYMNNGQSWGYEKRGWKWRY